MKCHTCRRSRQKTNQERERSKKEAINRKKNNRDTEIYMIINNIGNDHYNKILFAVVCI